MTTMPIDNNRHTRRSLQFLCIGVNKLTFNSINIIQSSNNYNIVSSFICWNQNIVHIKILDTSFKMTKRRFRFRGGGVTLSRLHKRLLKSFKEAAISLRHLGKSILDRTFRINIANSSVRICN